MLNFIPNSYCLNNDIGVIYNPPDLNLMGKTTKIKFSTKGGVENGIKGQLKVMENWEVQGILSF